MKKLLPVVFLLLGGFGFYLYSTGQLSGVTDGANVGDAGHAAGQGLDKAQQAGEAFYAQPWFAAAVVAIGGTVLLRWLWSKMSGPIRGAFIVAITIAITIFVTTVKH